MPQNRVIVALDFSNQNDAMSFVDKVDPTACRLKVGKEMFTYFGPDFVKSLVHRGFDVFLDLKFHDIPNTVAKACVAAADLGVWMVNVHAVGGQKMMETAKQAVVAAGGHQPKLIAVTVLTSMSEADLKQTGIQSDIPTQVKHLARLTQDSGFDGVVCSAHEASMLKSEIGQGFQLVTPGIRPQGSAQGDQTRIMTPQQAVNAGVDYMVIGRPITQSDDPAETLRNINLSIQ